MFLPFRRAAVMVLASIASAIPNAVAQPTPPLQPRSATTVIQDLIAGAEKQLTGIANEMPADKYNFAPTNGEFRGVRTFAKQLKHAAAFQYLVAASILEEPITADMSDERGPDSVKTKAEILTYLKESFASLKRAASTIDDKNAFSPIKTVFGSRPETRLGLIAGAISHSFNHYGQIVEYLRMNGLIPPGSQ
jgi:uncharacterized damage-inducible protein DinB